MLSTPHLLVGAAIGTLSPNPMIAFIAGFISHLIIDKIPHWDWRPTNLKLKIFALAEFFFGAAMLFYLTKNSSDPFLIWAGAVGGVTPDALGAPYYLLDIKIDLIEPFRRFHNVIQKRERKVTLFVGLFLQILVMIITSLVLLR